MRRLALLLAVSLSLSTAAHAKKGGKKGKDDGIELTGIEAFDSVFTRVKDIDKRLTSAEDLLTAGKKDLNTALDLKRGTPFADALDELKEVADGKLALAMDGKLPKLQATDAVPSNVQSAIDAVNELTAGIVGTVEELVGIPEETEKLVKQTKKFPDRLKTEFEADPLTMLLKAPKLTKTLKSNAEITAGLPSRSTKVVSRMNDMVDVVRTEIPVRGGADAGGGKVGKTPTKGKP